MDVLRDEPTPVPDVITVCESVTLNEELNRWCVVCDLPTGYHAVYLCSVDGQALDVLELRGCTECGPA